VERIDTDLLFRWFLDMSPDDDVFDATAFTHNRPRLDRQGLTAAFFDAVLVKAVQAGLCSDEHFSVDGSLIESYASIKSFRPLEEEHPRNDAANSFKPRNAELDFHGEKRTNDTPASRTDPEAKLYRKGGGKEAKLAHLGHALTENRHGLVWGVTTTAATGKAECQAALCLLDRLKSRHDLSPQTIGADKGSDSGPFSLELEQRGIEPHCAMLRQPEPDPRQIYRAAEGPRSQRKEAQTARPEPRAKPEQPTRRAASPPNGHQNSVRTKKMCLLQQPASAASTQVTRGNPRFHRRAVPRDRYTWMERALGP
jgi:hypothetical protein